MSNRNEYRVRKIKNGYIRTSSGLTRTKDGWEVIKADTKERIGDIFPEPKSAQLAANKLITNHDHPMVFVDTKIAALLRCCLWAMRKPDGDYRGEDGWIPQAELSRYYGQQVYGRSDLYHRQAGDKRWIIYKDVDTGRLGKPRSRWNNDLQRNERQPPLPITHRYWRWNLGTIEDYFKLLTNDQLAAAFIFCEDGMTGQVRGKHPNGQWYLKQGSYSEGGRVFTSQDQWGVWAQYANNEINRRGHK